jgi:hypothetical protein
MFVNGQGMSGGEFNDSLSEATFLGELELSIIELEDGSGAFSMRMRDTALASPDTIDISEGGWRAYCAKNGLRFEGNRA